MNRQAYKKREKKKGEEATDWSVYQGHDRIGRIRLDKKAKIFYVFNTLDQKIGTATTLLKAARSLPMPRGYGHERERAPTRRSVDR